MNRQRFLTTLLSTAVTAAAATLAAPALAQSD